MQAEKGFYGLKQAPRAYGRIDGFLVSPKFTKSDADPNLYYKVVNGEPLILVLYVDDLFLLEMINLSYGVRRNSPLSSK